MKGLPSLNHHLDEAIKSLNPDIRSEHYFEYWKTIAEKHQAGLLSNEEMHEFQQKALFNAIAGLQGGQISNFSYTLLDKFFQMIFGFYLHERAYHLEVLEELCRAHEAIIKTDITIHPESSDEWKRPLQVIKERRNYLLDEIREIHSMDYWDTTGKEIGMNKPELSDDLIKRLKKSAHK